MSKDKLKQMLYQELSFYSKFRGCPISEFDFHSKEDFESFFGENLPVYDSNLKFWGVVSLKRIFLNRMEEFLVGITPNFKFEKLEKPQFMDLETSVSDIDNLYKNTLANNENPDMGEDFFCDLENLFENTLEMETSQDLIGLIHVDDI